MAERKNNHTCPFCQKPWNLKPATRSRLKINKKTNVQCNFCGEWFEVLYEEPKLEVSAIDRRRKEYKRFLLCQNNIQ